MNIENSLIVNRQSSLGLAYFPDHGTTVTDITGILKAADLALYQAKAEGRDRFVVAPLQQSKS